MTSYNTKNRGDICLVLWHASVESGRVQSPGIGKHLRLAHLDSKRSCRFRSLHRPLQQAEARGVPLAADGDDVVVYLLVTLRIASLISVTSPVQ